MDLGSKIISGSGFQLLAGLVQQLLSIVLVAAVAAALGPIVFGVSALALAFSRLVAMITNLGLGASILQARDLSEVQLSSLFWIGAGLYFVTWVGVFVSAPYVAIFYEDDQLVPLIRLLSITIIVRPLYIIHERLLERSLDFTFLSITSIAASVIATLLSFLLLQHGFGLYALIAQPILMTLLRMPIIIVRCAWRPSFKFAFSPTKPLLLFSIKYKLNNVISFLSRNIDTFLIGKIFDVATLGIYSFAYNIMYSPVKRISEVLVKVLFPSLAKIQEDRDQILFYYLQTLRWVSLLVCPSMAVLFCYVEFGVGLFFGAEWLQSAGLIKIFCFAGIFYALSHLGNSVFFAVGKPEIAIEIAIVRLVTISLSVSFGSNFGLEGIGLMMSGSLLFIFHFGASKIKKLLGCEIGAIVASVLPGIAAGAVILLSGLLSLDQTTPVLPGAIYMVVVGALLYRARRQIAI